VSNSHRVVVEFDGGAYAVRLIHPEGGCQPTTTCGECYADLSTTPDSQRCDYCPGWEPDGCWVQGWYDSDGIELLNGRIEVVVAPTWDGEVCRLPVVGVVIPTTEEEAT
jgi:hypothetical protein